MVRQIVVTSGGVWFQADAAVYRIQGGTISTEVTCADSLTCTLTGLEGDRLLIRDGASYQDESGQAVTYPAWKSPVEGLPVPPSDAVIAPNGDRIGKYDELDDDFRPTSTSWVVLSPGAAEARQVASGAGGGGKRSVVYGAGAAWTNAHRTDPFVTPDPDTIWRVDVNGGSIGPVTVDKPGAVRLVTSEFIYFERDKSNENGEQGIWRAPVAGGTAERVTTFVPLWDDIASDDTHVVFSDAGALYSVADTAGAMATKVIDLPIRTTIDKSCTGHGLAVKDGVIYASIFDQARDMSLIYKVAVP